MPLAPSLSQYLTTPGVARPWGLTLEGSSDVLRNAPGMAGGVPVESVLLELEAPGGVSGLTFTLEDPDKAWRVPQAGDLVQLRDNTRGRVLFTGWLQTPKRRRFGLGRAFDCEASGAEVALDWSILTSGATFPAITTLRDAIQAVCGLAAWGAPGINVTGPAVALDPSTAGQPLSGFTNGPLLVPVTVNTGDTLRSAINALITAARGAISTDGTFLPVVTVDPYMGLRGYVVIVGATQGMYITPADFGTLTVSAAAMPAVAPAELEDVVDGGAAVRGVRIAGAGVSGWVMDGTGRPGALSYLSDSSIASELSLLATGNAIIEPKRDLRRGTFQLEDWDPAAWHPPFSMLALTDTTTGVAGSWLIGGMELGINPNGTYRAKVTYGADPPSDIVAFAWI